MKILLLLFLTISLYAQKPELFLLQNYKEDSNITSWFMSEKLDGELWSQRENFSNKES